MTRVQPTAKPNWCPQVKPDEPWTGRCVKEKIADDSKRHRCHKTEKHNDIMHACKCSVEWQPILGEYPTGALSPAYTGMRQGELLGLTWDRVDRARGVVLLERTKSGRRREVPLNGPADAILARRTPETPGDRLVFETRSWYTFRGQWGASVTAAGWRTSGFTTFATPSPRGRFSGARPCPS